MRPPPAAARERAEGPVRSRRVGGAEVGAVGLGVADVAMVPGHRDERDAVRTVHAALDAGVTLIDTADTYAPGPDAVGHGERLVAKALAAFPGDATRVLVATKFGHIRTTDGGWLLDGRPEHVRRACDASLNALGVEAIGLYQYHRPDPDVPYCETIGALRELRDAGKVRMAGVCNADLEQIEAARRVLGERGLAAVQNELSPWFRSSEPELRHCAEHGIAFLPWRPFGGLSRASGLAAGHPALAQIAAARGVSPQRVCLGWMLHLAPNVIPLVGASRPETVRDSAAAAGLELTPEELGSLERMGT
jgi:aryl-alcohol dehydrogenase-like predicted oxidoreductase